MTQDDTRHRSSTQSVSTQASSTQDRIKRPRSIFRAAAWLWLVSSVIFLFVPLVQVLGYESAIAINVLVAMLGGPMLFGRGASGTVWTRFWRRTACLSAWSALSAALLITNMLRVPNCDLGSGVILWALFGLGGIPPIVALTLLCERWTSHKKWQFAGYYAVIALSLLVSVAWLALQPPLVVYDAFTGFWAVSIYDEALNSWHTHLPYRAMTWVGAALVCHALALEEVPSRSGLAWTAVLAVTFGGFIVASDDLHITRSRAYAERVLGAQVETEHFVIVYEAAAFSKRQVVELIADHERQYDELVEFWGVEPRQKMRSYIYASSDTRADAMGVYSTMIARVWLNEMHLVWRGFGDPLLKHEMSHLMLREHGRGPLRLSSRTGILPSMGLVEGAASAAAWDVDELDDHGWSAAILATGQMEDVAQMLGASSFWSQPSRLSYTVWSSFSRWLIETRGAEVFLDAYRDANFERAYGVSLRTLVDEWTEFLETIELDAAQRAAAQMRFERPALFQRMCGRAIATREHEARMSVRHHDRRASSQAIAWLERHGAQDPYLQLRIADLWARVGDATSAERMARGVLNDKSVGPELAQRARLVLADLAWVRDDASSALAWLTQMRAHPYTHAMARALWVRESLIKQRATSQRAYRAGRRYLAEPWEYDALTLRIDLVASALEEKSTAAAWLAYRVSAQQSEAEATPLLAELLETSALVPAVHAQFLSDRLAWAARRADRAACREAWIEDFPSSKTSNAVSADAQLLMERCRVSGRYLDAARRVVE